MKTRGFIPSTGFGHKASLDEYVRPFLGRVAGTVVVDYLGRGRVGGLPAGVSKLMSPGSSRILEQGAQVRETGDGLGELGWPSPDSLDEEPMNWLTPQEVMEEQRRGAAAGWPLEFWVTPETSEDEAKKRVRLTLANAKWASGQASRTELMGPVVGWDEESCAACAREILAMGYESVVMCGLWTWVRQPALTGRMVSEVRKVIGPSVRLHVSGLCSPDVAKRLASYGVDSLDGAGHVRAADRGVDWEENSVLGDASALEKTHLALKNAAAIERAMKAGWLLAGHG